MGSATDISDFLNDPFSEGCGDFVVSDGSISVVIDPPQVTAKALAGAYTKVLAQSQLQMVILESARSIMEVNSFLARYADAQNKESFLKSEQLKSSFDEQVKAHIMEQLREANIGYLKCAGADEKEVAEKALRLTVGVFCEIQKYRERSQEITIVFSKHPSSLL